MPTDALLIVTDGARPPAPVSVETVGELAALASVLGVVWEHVELSSSGFVAHLIGDRDAIATVAASVDDPWGASVVFVDRQAD